TPTDLGVATGAGPAVLDCYLDVLLLKYLPEMLMPIVSGVMRQLACGDSVITLVVFEQTPAVAPPGGIAGATGNRYWTISVSNLTEMLQACESAGDKVVGREKEIRPGVKIGIVADPDGNWVEVLSITPTPQ